MMNGKKWKKERVEDDRYTWGLQGFEFQVDDATLPLVNLS